MNDFVAHPSSITFRPDIKTDEPRIDSLQTAFVVGPPGEEIYTDEYGRVRVKFFWDLTPGDDNGACSCWMRVMAPPQARSVASIIIRWMTRRCGCSCRPTPWTI